MVFFTCSHCGDSIKKPAVLKHQMKCKRRIALTCMDCLKDFDEETFKTHTTCISEEQRYSGKDYVPKESSNKGAKKQAYWVDIVRSILNDPNEYQINDNLKQILLRIQGYDNIPRKKVKFENFISSCLKIPRSKAEAVWKLLEKGLEKLKQKTQEDQKKNSKKNGNKDEDNSTDPDAKPSSNGNLENGKEEVKNGNEEEKDNEKIKSNKRKLTEENKDDASVATTVEPAKKKKKKNKNKEQAVIKEQEKKVQITNSLPSNGVNQTEQEEVEAKTGNDAPDEDVNTFDWKTIILNIVSKNSNGIQIDKLKEKVLKTYKSFHNVDELPHKIEKTFNKKLKKTPSLVIQDGIVRIMNQ